ncbi:MAG: FtsH protease activity modulator HflK [Planctomycetes bacterium]|nr:FtsH protease activity modulator HflK [Planctomycetota bacterium]MCH8120971.1 FtsH protease activity modulator HflK [Planctomycetota bacterium]
MERISQWETGDYKIIFDLSKQWLPRLKWAVPFLLILWILSGVYIVGPDEQGVVRRFGKVVRITEPGPHYRLPRPIEKVDKPKIQQVRRIEIGFETISQGPPARYRFHPEESLMLTGDEQIIDAQVIVQYKIKDAADYLFNVRNLEGPQGTIKDAAEVALRQVVGQRPIDDVLIREKLQVEIDIRALLQEIVDGYESGVRIIEVKLQTVQPPKEVAASFSDVVSAKEDKEKLIQEAEGYKEDIIPKARGEARSRVLEAEGYKEEKIKRAQGDVANFLAVLKEYEKAKDVTRKRLYLETMEKVLPGIKKFIIDSKTGEGLLKLLPLEGAPFSNTTQNPNPEPRR